MGGGMTMGLGAGCEGGEGSCSKPAPLFMVPAGSMVIGVGGGGILSGVQVGLLLAAAVVPATMGYVGGSSGPCDCLLRMSNV